MALITPSNTNSAVAFAGNALRKHGKNPRQYPLHPASLYTALAASLHLGYLRSAPNPSVMMRCLTTSDGYEKIQNICADSPPAQKLTAGSDRGVCRRSALEYRSYVDHQQKKKERKSSVAKSPRYKPPSPWLRN